MAASDPDNVFITGANRGIGLALCRQLVSKGHTVIATARNPVGAPALHELQDQWPERVHLFPLDVTDRKSVRQALVSVAAADLGIDVLVNNAGVFPESGDEPFERFDLDLLAQAWEVNVMGTARVTQAALPLLRKSERPTIVNVSSGAGSISTKEDGRRYAYGLSKAGLNMLTRTLAHELKHDGITVVAMSPGWVRTEMGGDNADLSVEESAQAMADTIGKLTLKKTGLFLDRNGDSGVYAW